MVKKIFYSTLVLAFGLSIMSVTPRSAFATNFPSWHWEKQAISSYVTIDMPVDDRCDNASPAFRVTIFEGGNYTGARARLCGYWDDLSQLPQSKAANAPTFNNSVSSYKVTYVPGGYAIQFNSLKDQQGIAWVRGEGNVNEAGGDVDNILSSLKRINP